MRKDVCCRQDKKIIVSLDRFGSFKLIWFHVYWSFLQENLIRQIQSCGSCIVWLSCVSLFRLSRSGEQSGVQEPLQRVSGLYASADSGSPTCWPDQGATKAAGKLQPLADRHVRHHRQVSLQKYHLLFFSLLLFFPFHQHIPQLTECEATQRHVSSIHVSVSIVASLTFLIVFLC